MALTAQKRITTTNRITLSTLRGKKVMRIPVLRQASFNAGSYGPLDFDETMFQMIQLNFNDGTIGHDVSLDRSHKPDEGALGWVRELRREGDNLIAYAEPTPKGKKLIEDKEFMYASADIALDFEDRETGDRFGPALMGIAFTNRPYVHRQEPITIVQLSQHTAELRATDDEFHVFFADDPEHEVVNARQSRNGGTMAKRRIPRETIELASPTMKKAKKATKLMGVAARMRSSVSAASQPRTTTRMGKTTQLPSKPGKPSTSPNKGRSRQVGWSTTKINGKLVEARNYGGRKASKARPPVRKFTVAEDTTLELTAHSVAENLLLWNEAARTESIRTRQMARRVAEDLEVGDPRFAMTPALVRALIKQATDSDDDLTFPAFVLSTRDQRRLEELGFEKNSEEGTMVLEMEGFADARKNASKVGLKQDWTDTDHEGWEAFAAMLEASSEEDEETDEDEDEVGEDEDDEGDEDEGVELSNRDRREILRLKQQLNQSNRTLSSFVASNRTKLVNDAIRAAKERGVPAHVLNFAQNALEVTQTDMGDTILQLSEKGANGRKTTRDLDTFGVVLELVGMIPGKIPTRAKGDQGLILSDDDATDAQANDRMRRAVRRLSATAGYTRSDGLDGSDAE